MVNIERERLEKKYEAVIEVNPALNRQLVSFQANKKIPFYNWFGYKEGFSVDMIKMFIRDYSKKNGKVLDPFSGAGTTLFAASDMGFDATGIELLPSGEFILKTRNAVESLDIEKFVAEIRKIKTMNFDDSSKPNKFRHIRITEMAFPKKTEQQLNSFLHYADSIKDKTTQQLLKFACFSILEKISFTRKDGQYLRWDYRAKKGKTSFDKGKIYSFDEALGEKLTQMANDIHAYKSLTAPSKKKGKTELKTGSSLEILPTLEDNDFDLIISSPPYCNRYDYTRTYALELVLLGVNENKIRELRQEMLSCTVENKDKIDLLKTLYNKSGQKETFEKAEEAFNNVKALQEVLTELEKKRVEKKLNNPGIYRMVKNYFYEHAFVIFEMARILKKGGRIYYVNDNVRYAGEIVPVDLILSEFAQKAGLNVKKIYKLAKGKGNSSQQMGLHGRQEVRKCVYYWEK